jgi:hypothetical protein
MTYRAILASETAENAPVTQALMDALRQNEAAFASGATGAPRIVRSAMADDGFLATAAGATFTITGLAHVKALRLIGGCFRPGSIGTGTVNIAFSTNNGSTFAAAINLYTIPASTIAGIGVNGTLDLDTGAWRRQEIDTPNNSANFSSSTLTVPAGVNAVRFTSAGTGTNYSFGVHVEAGRVTF